MSSAAKYGVWQAGPVIFDFDGLVAVARCSECFDWSRFRIGAPIGTGAVAHASRTHGFKGRSVPLPDPREEVAA